MLIENDARPSLARETKSVLMTYSLLPDQNYAPTVSTHPSRVPIYTATGIAMFLLVSGAGFLIVSTVAMVLFFRERNAFEIRAR